MLRQGLWRGRWRGRGYNKVDNTTKNSIFCPFILKSHFDPNHLQKTELKWKTRTKKEKKKERVGRPRRWMEEWIVILFYLLFLHMRCRIMCSHRHHYTDLLIGFVPNHHTVPAFQNDTTAANKRHDDVRLVPLTISCHNSVHPAAS